MTIRVEALAMAKGSSSFRIADWGRLVVDLHEVVGLSHEPDSIRRALELGEFDSRFADLHPSLVLLGALLLAVMENQILL